MPQNSFCRDSEEACFRVGTPSNDRRDGATPYLLPQVLRNVMVVDVVTGRRQRRRWRRVRRHRRRVLGGRIEGHQGQRLQFFGSGNSGAFEEKSGTGNAARRRPRLLDSVGDPEVEHLRKRSKTTCRNLFSGKLRWLTFINQYLFQTKRSVTQTTLTSISDEKSDRWCRQRRRTFASSDFRRQRHLWRFSAKRRKTFCRKNSKTEIFFCESRFLIVKMNPSLSRSDTKLRPKILFSDKFSRPRDNSKRTRVRTFGSGQRRRKSGLGGWGGNPRREIWNGLERKFRPFSVSYLGLLLNLYLSHLNWLSLPLTFSITDTYLILSLYIVYCPFSISIPRCICLSIYQQLLIKLFFSIRNFTFESSVGRRWRLSQSLSLFISCPFSFSVSFWIFVYFKF